MATNINCISHWFDSTRREKERERERERKREREKERKRERRRAQRRDESKAARLINLDIYSHTAIWPWG